MNTVKSHLAPLLNTSHESVQDIDQELRYVARLLCFSAEKTLSLIQPRKPQRWMDDTSTALCAQSRSARTAWKVAGCPSGEKRQFMQGCKEEGQICAAKAERMRIQRREIRRSQLGQGVISDVRKNNRCSIMGSVFQ